MHGLFLTITPIFWLCGSIWISSKVPSFKLALKDILSGQDSDPVTSPE
jgi:hypothetical protein